MYRTATIPTLCLALSIPLENKKPVIRQVFFVLFQGELSNQVLVDMIYFINNSLFDYSNEYSND